MRRITVLVAAFGLFVAACGGGSGESCSDIADDAVDLFQELITEAEGLTAEELASEETPAVFNEIEEKAEELDDRANDAGCSEDELSRLVAERAGSIETDTQLGQFFVEELERGSFFE